MKSPVLFLVFNRPDTTRQVFQAIRSARPPKLYIAADGPRVSRPGEADRCNEVRRVAKEIDWPCELHTLYRERNLGCKIAVSDAITWFFDQESEGVILEDDVLPLPTFFDYCDEMLERYRRDDRVAMITGCNLVSRHFRPKESYFFSRYCHIWGWASWRRAWRHYDAAMTKWPGWRDNHGLAKMPGANRVFEAYWRPTFDAVHAGNIDTWDYQWTFACWYLGGLTVMPGVNQTHNLGFGEDATHTTAAAPEYVMESRPEPLRFPLVHPGAVERESRADAAIDSKVFRIEIMSILKRRLRTVLAARNAALSFAASVKNAFR
jgi:hypothetical protein